VETSKGEKGHWIRDSPLKILHDKEKGEERQLKGEDTYDVLKKRSEGNTPKGVPI